MAYADSDRSTIKPAGVAAAVLINGGGALAALFLVSTLVVKEKNKPIPTEWIENPLPPMEQKVDDQKKVEVPTGPTQTRKTPTKPQPEVSEKTAAGGETAQGGAGEVIQPPLEKPVQPPVPTPVIVGASLDPRYAALLQPDYPPSMIRAEREGTVSVRVLIGTDGRVKDVIILSATTPEFAEATKRQALRKWRFRAGSRDGVPQDSWKEMTVRFQMPT